MKSNARRIVHPPFVPLFGCETRITAAQAHKSNGGLAPLNGHCPTANRIKARSVLEGSVDRRNMSDTARKASIKITVLQMRSSHFIDDSVHIDPINGRVLSKRLIKPYSNAPMPAAVPLPQVAASIRTDFSQNRRLIAIHAVTSPMTSPVQTP